MKLKLRYKILLLYISVSLCILTILGSLLSSALRNIIITTISDNYRKQLEHIDYGLTGFFKNIEYDLETIAQNEWGPGPSFASIGKNIVQFAEEFDFDAIKLLADKLEKQAK